MTFAELTGAATYIVHLSCREALQEALAGRNFEGAKYGMSPPLRDAANQPVLWDALRAGDISTVATDHAPFHFKTQKTMGRDDFTKIPNGIPSLEDRINVLYTAA